jgi:hypothetical protein
MDPLPVPLKGLDKPSHVALDWTIHAQPFWVVILSELLPPEARKAVRAGERR